MTEQPGGLLSSEEPCYIISIAARLVNMHPQTLRYYERLGLISPSRSEGKIRLYSARDVERLRQIHRLVKDLGVNLAGVEVILNMAEQVASLKVELDHVRATTGAEIERLRHLAGETVEAESVRAEMLRPPLSTPDPIQEQRG
ncbi:MAG: helix-turn-helix transcriptional regulator [Chloroflexi bacterium]|nr:helix-turn-helix transcriptional regulator [Chloroflexota bacterium]